MAIADGNSLPIAICTASASPHEVTLVDETLKHCFIKEIVPKFLIGDRAYDSDPLDEKLKSVHGIELVAPHRQNRVKEPTQTHDKLAGYKRRWKIERLFAWLQNFRRLVTRFERHSENFLALVQLGCAVILLRHL
jgi:transposase